MRVFGALVNVFLPVSVLATEDVTSLVQEPADPAPQHHRKALWEPVPPEPRKEAPPPAPIVGKLMTAMSNREAQHQARVQERRANMASKFQEIDAEEKPIDTAEFREKVEKVMRYVPFSNIFMPRLMKHYEDEANEVPLLAAKKTAGKKYMLKEPTKDEAEQESETSQPEKKQDEPTALARALRMVTTGASGLIRDQWNLGKTQKTTSWRDVKKKLGIPGSLKEAYEAEKLPSNAPAHLKVIEKKMESAAKKMLTKRQEDADEEEAAPMSEDEEEWQSHLYADLKSDTASKVTATKEESVEEEEDSADGEAEVDELKGGNAEWRKAQKEERARKNQYQIGKQFAWPVTSEVKQMLWDKLPGSGWCVPLRGGADVSRRMSQGTVCRDSCAEDPTCPGYSIQDGPSGVCGWYTDNEPELGNSTALEFFPAGAYYAESSPDGWESGSCMRKRLPFYWKKHPHDHSRHLFGR